jgi:hypothetical protein
VDRDGEPAELKRKGQQRSTGQERGRSNWSAIRNWERRTGWLEEGCCVGSREAFIERWAIGGSTRQKAL